MRCDKMHATIAVKQCLANQSKLAGIEGGRAKSLRYPGCQDCPTGALARKGKLNDEDLQALLDGYHNRANPPADVVTEAETRIMETAQKLEETVMEEEKRAASKAKPDDERKCTKCKKPKPIERFSRHKKGEEERKSICMDCEAAYQRERKARIRADQETGKSEQQNSRISNIEPQKEGVRQLVSPYASPLTPHPSPSEEQAEPAPAKEITAPACPQNEDLILENQLLLDFSCYPEVLKEIKRIAHHEERPPEVQARYMLKRLLQGGLPEECTSGYQPTFIGVDKAKGPDQTVFRPRPSFLPPHRNEAACC